MGTCGSGSGPRPGEPPGAPGCIDAPMPLADAGRAVRARVAARGLRTAEGGHPNRMDLARIARALLLRRRYRYVAPVVAPVDGGYEVASPNCSRNVDPAGGVIPIARLQHDDEGGWWLFARDHAAGRWVAGARYAALADAVAALNADAGRVFWP